MKLLLKALLSLLMLMVVISSSNAAEETAYASSSGGDFKKVGAAGSQFLKIGIGARGNGMAGAFGSVVNDLTAVHWNPAGIADVRTMAANFSYTSWFAGFSHNFGSFGMPIGENFTAALSIISFDSDEIPITTMNQADGTGAFYKVQDVAIAASFGGYLTDQFSFGITGKLVQNTFASMESTGLAFDIGTMYDTGIQGIRLGFSIHNLGTEQAYEGEGLKTTKKLNDAMYASPLDASYLAYPYGLPLTFRASISSMIIDTERHRLLGAFDFVTLSDTPEQFVLGAEYSYLETFHVRAGYVMGQDQFGVAAGAGVSYTGGGFMGKVDYSFSPTIDLGSVHRLTVGLSFGD